MKNKVDKFTIY